MKKTFRRIYQWMRQDAHLCCRKHCPWERCTSCWRKTTWVL